MRLLPLSCLLSLIVSSTVRAQEIGAPADVIKDRQAVMKALGAHVKALGPLAAKKVNLPGHAEVHARAIVDLARISRDLFPKGTGQATGLSDAKDSVWTEEKKFTAMLEEMSTSAEALLKAAQSGEGLKPALETLNDSCVSCHKPVRVAR